MKGANRVQIRTTETTRLVSTFFLSNVDDLPETATEFGADLGSVLDGYSLRKTAKTTPHIETLIRWFDIVRIDRQ